MGPGQLPHTPQPAPNSIPPLMSCVSNCVLLGTYRTAPRTLLLVVGLRLASKVLQLSNES